MAEHRRDDEVQSFFYKNNYYFLKKGAEKFGGFKIMLYLCSVIKTTTEMKRQDIINEVEKTMCVKLAWNKDYNNGTMLTEYVLYYSKRARKPLAWLQVGYFTDSNEVMSAGISFNQNGEHQEYEIENLEDVEKIITKNFGNIK